MPTIEPFSFKQVALNAFEETYSGAGDDDRRDVLGADFRKIPPPRELASYMFSAFIGTPYKYQDGVIKENRNFYDWLEQVIFLVPRIAKNTLKLFTEFLPNLLQFGFLNLILILGKEKSNEKSKIKSVKTNLKIFFLNFAIAVCTVSVIASWIIGTIGQSITSPITAMKQTLASFGRNPVTRFIGLMLAGVRGLIALSAYAAAVLFLAPIVAPALAATTVGANIVAGISAAASWIASVPALSAIGSSVVSGLTTLASSFGLTLTAGLISAVGLAAGVMLGLPILAGLRAFAQKFSPNVPSCCCKPWSSSRVLMAEKDKLFTFNSGSQSQEEKVSVVETTNIVIEKQDQRPEPESWTLGLQSSGEREIGCIGWQAFPDCYGSMRRGRT